MCGRDVRNHPCGGGVSNSAGHDVNGVLRPVSPVDLVALLRAAGVDCSAAKGRLARRALAVQAGDMACLRTWNGRLGYVTVTDVSGPAEFEVEVTVWDAG